MKACPTRHMVTSLNDVEKTSAWTDYNKFSSNHNPISVGYMKNKTYLVNEKICSCRKGKVSI